MCLPSGNSLVAIFYICLQVWGSVHAFRQLLSNHLLCPGLCVCPPCGNSSIASLYIRLPVWASASAFRPLLGSSSLHYLPSGRRRGPPSGNSFGPSFTCVRPSGKYSIAILHIFSFPVGATASAFCGQLFGVYGVILYGKLRRESAAADSTSDVDHESIWDQEIQQFLKHQLDHDRTGGSCTRWRPVGVALRPAPFCLKVKPVPGFFVSREASRESKVKLASEATYPSCYMVNFDLDFYQPWHSLSCLT